MIKRALIVLGIVILAIGLLADQLHLAALIVIPILAGILIYGLMTSCVTMGDRDGENQNTTDKK